VALKQRNVAEQLVLPRERGPARALPPALSAVFGVALQIREHRKVLPVAPRARVHLRTVAPLEVVLQAHHRLQRPEPPVELVPVTAFERTREPHRAPCRAGFRRLRQCLRRLELVPVRAHVHAEIRVAPEAFPADLAEVDVLLEDFHGVELHDVVFRTIVVLGRFEFGIE